MQSADHQHLRDKEMPFSAAHIFASKLAGPLACLRNSSSAEWDSLDLQQFCSEALDLEELRSLTIEDHEFYLQNWNPGLKSGEMQIQQVGSQGSRVFRLGTLGIQEVR